MSEPDLMAALRVSLGLPAQRDHYRERALRAEAAERDLRETVGELLELVRRDLADEWYRRRFGA
jgi:hypothetical protein